MDASKIAKIGLVLTICALIFQVTALATPYWVFIESGGNKAFSGLWKTCFYYRIGTLYRRDCIAFTDVKGKLMFSIILLCSSVLLDKTRRKHFIKTHTLYIIEHFLQIIFSSCRLVYSCTGDKHIRMPFHFRCSCNDNPKNVYKDKKPIMFLAIGSDFFGCKNFFHCKHWLRHLSMFM